MSKTLIIAEKPSVAQDIVRALTPVAGKFDKHEDHFENERYTPALKKRFECRCGAPSCRGTMLAPKRSSRTAKA